MAAPQWQSCALRMKRPNNSMLEDHLVNPAGLFAQHTPLRIDSGCKLPAGTIEAAAVLAQSAISCDPNVPTVRLPIRLEAGFFSTIHGVVGDALGAGATVNLVYPALSVWRSYGNDQCTHLDCYFEGYPRACGEHPAVLPAARRAMLVYTSQARSIAEGGSFARFAMAAALMARLTVPSPRMRTTLDAAKAAIGWERARRPIIGLHVRDGDSCGAFEQQRTARTCGGLAEALPTIRALARAYGARTIFLATDGQHVVNATRRETDFEWLMLGDTVRFISPPAAPAPPPPLHTRVSTPLATRGAAHGARGARRSDRALEGSEAETEAEGMSLRIEARLARRAVHHVDGSVLAQQSLVDAMLLADADILVGKFTSNLFRAAVELKAGRLGALPPFVSLDAAWCFLYKGSVVRGKHAGKTFGC